MIPPDREIYDVEKRIAERRVRVERALRDTGRQTLRALTSPWALGAAALAGFVVAGGLRRRHASARARRHEAPTPAATGTLASLAMAGVTWFIKSQFGSPVDMARYVIGKVRDHGPARRQAAPPPLAPQSGVPDRLRPSRDRLRSRSREATTVR
ncbi:MAG TPA: hypothetical protein VFV74_10650 [Burkholderiales bacterium]|nr:hypothetical protein [Burkholderiales bacterium]